MLLAIHEQKHILMFFIVIVGPDLPKHPQNP